MSSKSKTLTNRVLIKITRSDGIHLEAVDGNTYNIVTGLIATLYDDSGVVIPDGERCGFCG